MRRSSWSSASPATGSRASRRRRAAARPRAPSRRRRSQSTTRCRRRRGARAPAPAPRGARRSASARRSRCGRRARSRASSGSHAGGQAQRQDAHADQVGAVDALEARGEHRADAEQALALGRPVARRAGAVALAGDEHDRVAGVAVALGRLPDRQHLAARRVQRVRDRRAAARSRLTQRLVVEGGAQHHLPIAAPRGEDVEVVAVVAARDQEVGDQAVGRDRAGRRDVVGGDVVAEHQQRMRGVAAELRCRSVERREGRPAQDRSKPGPTGSAAPSGASSACQSGLRAGAREGARDSRRVGAAARACASISSRRRPEVAQRDTARRRRVADRLVARGRARRRRRARRRPPAAAT